MKRRRVDRPLLIWPKESKKLDSNFGNNIIRFGLSSIGAAATGFIYDRLFYIFNKGYSKAYGISDMLMVDNLFFEYVILICIFTFLLMYIVMKYIDKISYGKNVKEILVILLIMYFAFFFANRLLIYPNNFFDISTIFETAITSLSESIIPLLLLTIKYMPEIEPKQKKKKSIIRNYLQIFLYFVFISIVLFSFIRVTDFLVSTVQQFGKSYANTELTHRIISKSNPNENFLLLKNTNNKYILMEIIGFGYDNDVLTYIAEKGKYQYIDDITDWKIKEIYCKIKFKDN